MTLKEIYKIGWERDAYTCSNLRGKTTESGNNNTRFSYSEFKEMSGITVNEYDSDIEKYQDMRYSDFVEGGYFES